MKNVSVSFDIDDQTADYLKSFVKDYNKFSKIKQTYVLKTIEKFLISWTPYATDVKPDKRVQHLIKLIRPVYLLLMIKRESCNFKFKVIDEKTNATLQK